MGTYVFETLALFKRKAIFEENETIQTKSWLRPSGAQNHISSMIYLLI